jgi:hypothetical protein
MSPFLIGNLNNPPLNNINGGLVNMDGSSVGGIPFSSSTIPIGPHTLAPSGNNIQGAATNYPCAQKGGKINRKKINKISRKYKMKGSKKTIKKNVRRMKSRVRSRYSRKATTRSSRRASSRRRALMSVGGAFQSPMTTPNYPAGHSQYLNNNGSLSNTYSLGGPLSVGNSALATPPPYQQVVNASIPDNLNHNTLNSSGNIGAGSGFPSRGWF